MEPRDDRLPPSPAASRAPALSPAAFIRANLPPVPAPGAPELRLHLAHPGSGLRRYLEAGDPRSDAPAPYWAYAWGGGVALARYLLDRPALAAGRRVLDLGAGSGLVGIAAAKAGAVEVLAAEIDANGLAAIPLNAALNGVTVRTLGEDLLDPRSTLPSVDLVLVGDLFYAAGLAERTAAFLDRCLAAGMEVVVGDPYRSFLPRARLRLLADYPAPDFGDGAGGRASRAAVFAFIAP